MFCCTAVKSGASQQSHQHACCRDAPTDGQTNNLRQLTEIRPAIASHAQALLLLRQGEDVDERPHEKCREDDARISWSKASGDWGQVIPKMLKDKENRGGHDSDRTCDTYHVKVVRDTNSRVKSNEKAGRGANRSWNKADLL